MSEYDEMLARLKEVWEANSISVPLPAWLVEGNAAAYQAALLTTTQAAAALGVGRQRVRALILTGRLPAVKHGRDWMIERAALVAVASRPNGYPKGRPRTPSAHGERLEFGRAEKTALSVSPHLRDGS